MPSASVVRQIAESLRENEARAINQIEQITAAIGDQAALGLLAQTEGVEREGGMTLPDGSRRCTPGGVFFRLARRQLTRAQRRRIFWPAIAPARDGVRAVQPSGAGIVASRSSRPSDERRSRALTSGIRRATQSAMPNTSEMIRTKVDAFVTDIASLVHADALRMIEAVIGGARAPKTQARAKRLRAEPKAAVALPKRRAGERRSAGGVASAVSVVSAWIKANPGSRAEHIAAALGTTSKELALPIKKLLADGVIKSKGQKRGTKYWSA